MWSIWICCRHVNVWKHSHSVKVSVTEILSQKSQKKYLLIPCLYCPSNKLPLLTCISSAELYVTFDLLHRWHQIMQRKETTMSGRWQSELPLTINLQTLKASKADGYLAIIAKNTDTVEILEMLISHLILNLIFLHIKINEWCNK